MALTVGFTEKIFSGNPTVFGSWSFPSPLLNPTLVYRRSFSSLWRRLEELETLKLKASDKSLVYGVAKKLADVSGLVSGVVYRRIMPRCVDEFKAVRDLHAKISGKSVGELLQPKLFCELFLNWRPLRYQLALLEDSSRQVAVRWCRQSGKTTTFAAKAIYFCVAKPGSQALITSPGLRQSMIVSDRIEEHINRMNPVARRLGA